MQVMAHSKEAFRKAIRSGVLLLIGSATEERLAYRRDSHRRRRLALDGFLKNDTMPRPTARLLTIADEFFAVGASTTSFFKVLSRMASLDTRLSCPIFRVHVSSFC